MPDKARTVTRERYEEAMATIAAATNCGPECGKCCTPNVCLNMKNYAERIGYQPPAPAGLEMHGMKTYIEDGRCTLPPHMRPLCAGHSCKYPRATTPEEAEARKDSADFIRGLPNFHSGACRGDQAWVCFDDGTHNSIYREK